MIDRNIAEKMPFLRFYDDHGTEVVELTSWDGDRYHLPFEVGNVFDEALVVAVIKEDLLHSGCILEVEEAGTGFIQIRHHDELIDNLHTPYNRVQTWAIFWDTIQRRKMKIRFIRLPFLIPTWANGQVLFPRTILYTEGAWTHSFLAHEIRHVFQIEEMGLLRYWWYYITKLVRFGYHEHPLEDDARDAAWDPVYRDYAEQCLVQLYENGIPKGNVHEVTLRLA